jgi:hypothetical protein
MQIRAGFIPVSRELFDDSPGPSLSERLTFTLGTPWRRVELRARWLRLGYAPARWWYGAQDDWVEALGAG